MYEAAAAAAADDPNPNGSFLMVVREQIHVVVDDEGRIVRLLCCGQLTVSAEIPTPTPIISVWLNEPETFDVLRIAEPGPPVPIEILWLRHGVEMAFYHDQRGYLFTPADEPFHLMQYRLVDPPANIPIWITATERIEPATRQIVYRIRVESRFRSDERNVDRAVAEFLLVKIPVPRGTTNPRFVSNNTNPPGMLTLFRPERSEAIWFADDFPGESSAELEIKLNLPCEEQPMASERLPVTAQFFIENYNYSGLQPAEVTWCEWTRLIDGAKKPDIYTVGRASSTGFGYVFHIRRF